MIKNTRVLNDAALEKINGAAISEEALDSIEWAVTVFIASPKKSPFSCEV